MSKQNPPKDPSRREAMKTALKAGAYVAPVVIAANMPSTVHAQVSGPTGILTGTVTNAQNAQPIAGAVVTVSGRTATTNASGVYSIANAPAGSVTVTTTASGFTTRTDTVTVTAGGSTSFSMSLIPSAFLTTGVAMVLNWGAEPRDLDSHLVGPNSGGGRFHCYYSTPNPVPYVRLDVDDTSGFGPETITIGQVAGAFVPGTYNYYIHLYSGSGDFSTSAAIATVFSLGTQIAQFRASQATGALTRYWSVCTLNITAAGAVSITPVQQFVTTPPNRGVEDPLPPKA